MKHLKKFENFSVNEEEALFGLILTNKEANQKISDYIEDIKSGSFKKVEELKKDLEKYYKAQPVQGLGKDTWPWYVDNLKDFLKAPKKLEGQLESYPDNKMKPAAEVIEVEIARAILKDRLVTKKDGKWQVEGGRSYGATEHTFGGGA